MPGQRPSRLELGLYALCWAGPLAIGAVHPTTQVLLAATGLGLLLYAGFGPLRERGLRVTPLTWVMLAGLAWTFVQLVPLPVFMLRLLSPQAAMLRAEVGAFFAPITLDAAATWMEIAKQLSYLAVFVVAVEILRTREGTRRAAAAVALFGLTLIVLVVVHRMFGASRIYGLYELRTHPGSLFFGPFVNVNHAASVLVLCTLVSFGLAVGAEGIKRAGWTVLGVGTAVALLATTSRGGAIALGVGGFVLVALLASSRFGRARGLFLASAITIVIGATVFITAGGLRARLMRDVPGDSLFDNQKTRGYAVALRLVRLYPVVGVGRGAFEAPAAALRTDEENVRQVYAEDVVLQIATEWGLPIALALLLAAIYLLVAALQIVPTEPEVAGLCAAVIGVATHGLLDCGFEFPGVLLLWTLALGALIARSEVEKRNRRRARPRVHGEALIRAGAIGVGVLLLAAFSLPHQWETESDKLRAQIKEKQLPSPTVVDAMIARHPANAEVEILAGQVSIRRPDGKALHHLNRAMRLQPSSNVPHHLAAAELVRLGRMSQAALEFRLAIELGAYVSDAELVRILGSAAIDAVPRKAERYSQLGIAFATARRWDDTEHAFARADELGGGTKAHVAHILALQAAPLERQLDTLDALTRKAKDPEELILAIRSYVALKDPERAEEAFRIGNERFPSSAKLVVEGARAKVAHGDLPGARYLIGRTGPFDMRGRLLLAELAVELAERAGDADAADVARARVRLLRARPDTNTEGSP